MSTHTEDWPMPRTPTPTPRTLQIFQTYRARKAYLRVLIAKRVRSGPTVGLDHAIATMKRCVERTMVELLEWTALALQRDRASFNTEAKRQQGRMKGMGSGESKSD